MAREESEDKEQNLWEMMNEWMSNPKNRKIAVTGASAILLVSLGIVYNHLQHRATYTQADGSKCVEEPNLISYTRMCQRDNGSVEVSIEYPIGFERYVADANCNLTLVEGVINEYSTVNNTMPPDVKRVWTKQCRKDMKRFKPHLRSSRRNQ